jgi:hypothetical protein
MLFLTFPIDLKCRFFFRRKNKMQSSYPNFSLYYFNEVSQKYILFSERLPKDGAL